jgi:hypothetical protein
MPKAGSTKAGSQKAVPKAMTRSAKKAAALDTTPLLPKDEKKEAAAARKEAEAVAIAVCAEIEELGLCTKLNKQMLLDTVRSVFMILFKQCKDFDAIGPALRKMLKAFEEIQQNSSRADEVLKLFTEGVCVVNAVTKPPEGAHMTDESSCVQKDDVPEDSWDQNSYVPVYYGGHWYPNGADGDYWTQKGADGGDDNCYEPPCHGAVASWSDVAAAAAADGFTLKQGSIRNPRQKDQKGQQQFTMGAASWSDVSAKGAIGRVGVREKVIAHVGVPDDKVVAHRQFIANELGISLKDVTADYDDNGVQYFIVTKPDKIKLSHGPPSRNGSKTMFINKKINTGGLGRLNLDGGHLAIGFIDKLVDTLTAAFFRSDEPTIVLFKGNPTPIL